MTEPPPSGKYHSKLLNLLSRQSLKLKSDLAPRLRQTRMTIVWGIQAFLVSLHQILHSTPIGGRPLQQGIAWGWRRLQSQADAKQSQEIIPASDTAVQQVLQAIQITAVPETNLEQPEEASVQVPFTITIHDLPRRSLWSTVVAPIVQGWQWLRQRQRSSSESTPGSMVQPPSAIVLDPVQAADLQWLSSNHSQSNGALTNPETREVVTRGTDLSTSIAITLQGIATLLSNRHLVLVTTSNQILDLLTPEQQRQLQWRITWELAAYYRQVRIVRQLTGQRLSLPQWQAVQEIAGQTIEKDVRLPLANPSLADQLPPTAAVERRQLMPDLKSLSWIDWENLWMRTQNRWVNFLAAQMERFLSLSAPIHSPQLGATRSPQPFSNPMPTTPVAIVTGAAGPVKPNLVNAVRATAVPATSYATHLQPTLEGGVVAIDAESILVGYEKHVLEVVLEWLDRLIVWLEAIGDRLWSLCQKLLASYRRIKS